MKMKRSIWISLFLIIILTITGCTDNQGSQLPPDTKNEPLSRTEFLMDTVMTIRIYDKTDGKILDSAFARLKEIEDRMSATIETSDISNINNHAGMKPVIVNEDTYYVLEKAKEYAQLSNGAYDPTIGPLVDLWNIVADEKERDYIPSETEIEETQRLIDYTKLELLGNNQVFLKEKGMKVVLGSIVKGYAADEVKRVLVENGVNAAIIDLGGNVYAHGEKADGSTWKIGIRDPLLFTGSYLGIAQVIDKSVVTSGGYERYFKYNDKIYHHILDPKTGYPSDNEMLGISIISEYSIDGDALSTTTFILGVDDGMKLINSLEGVEAIFITKDNDIYVTDGLKDSFIMTNGTNYKIKEY